LNKKGDESINEIIARKTINENEEEIIGINLNKDWRRDRTNY
jgi:hypothetical protein